MTTKRPDMRTYFRFRIQHHTVGMFAGRDPGRPAGVARVTGDVTDRIITVSMTDGSVWYWRGGAYAARKINGCYAPLMPKPLPCAPESE